MILYSKGIFKSLLPALILICSIIVSRAVAQTANPLFARYSLIHPSDQAVEKILSLMSIEEKLGQLFLVYFKGPSLSPKISEMIDEFHVGGIILYASSENIQNPVQVANLINAAQREASIHGAFIPLFIAIDQEGGSVIRLTEGATIFPGNMAIGATGSVQDARLMAMITAKELKALGINMNFAPVVDVNNNPDNPVIGIRSFGSSAQQVAVMGSAMIRAYDTYGIISTAKHFPGHGDTSMDSHSGLPVIPHDLARLESIEFIPFQQAIDAGVPAIMTAHVVMPALEEREAVPATLSYAILTNLLRKRMGFKGLIVTDSLGMGAIDSRYGMADAALYALKAGADILLFGADKDHDPSEQIMVFRHLFNAVHAGKISIGRLDESVRRILQTKIRYGLFDSSAVSVEEIPQKVCTPKNQVIADMLARNSITLIRDEKGFLPLSEDLPVLIIWPQGNGKPEEALCDYHTKAAALSVSLDPIPSEIDAAVRTAQYYPQVIVGSSDTRAHKGQEDLIRALFRMHARLIVVSLKSPYDLMCFPNIPCYLAIYGNRAVSLHALARMLLGKEKPRGRLPVDLPGIYSAGHGLMDFTGQATGSEKRADSL